MNINHRRWALRITVAGALVALTCFWPSIRLMAFNPQPDPPGFAVIGFVPGETMRIYTYCVAKPIGTIPPGPCDVQITFRNLSGATLKTVEQTVQPGETGHLDLPSTAIKFPNGSNHIGIYPQVDFATGHIIPSVETFDTTTGESHIASEAAVPRLSLIAGQ